MSWSSVDLECPRDGRVEVELNAANQTAQLGVIVQDLELAAATEADEPDGDEAVPEPEEGGAFHNQA
jgi:hypothetical protein